MFNDRGSRSKYTGALDNEFIAGSRFHNFWLSATVSSIPLFALILDASGIWEAIRATSATGAPPIIYCLGSHEWSNIMMRGL